MTGVHSAMHGSKAKPWMQRTVVSLRFQKLEALCTGGKHCKPLGHYDETSRHVFLHRRGWRMQRIQERRRMWVSAIAESQANDDHYYGGNLFYDHRFRGNHGRMSVGLEYCIGDRCFRMNWYRGCPASVPLTV